VWCGVLSHDHGGEAPFREPNARECSSLFLCVILINVMVLGQGRRKVLFFVICRWWLVWLVYLFVGFWLVGLGHFFNCSFGFGFWVYGVLACMKEKWR